MYSHDLDILFCIQNICIILVNFVVKIMDSLVMSKIVLTQASFNMQQCSRQRVCLNVQS